MNSSPVTFSSLRPVAEKRCFQNPAVEALIAEVSGAIGDPELAWLFENCLPNTLDTTVDHRIGADGRPDTYVITGDIDAMWLRDSAAQIWPYLPLARTDAAMRALIAGVINRQTDGVLLDPYANAFYRDPVLGHWKNDGTVMLPGVHERKWELDSLAYFMRLSHGYWAATGDISPFGDKWRRAVASVFALLRVEQAAGDPNGSVRSPYSFVRPGVAFESLPRDGCGLPIRNCGLIRCGFRPSDDLVKYPFLVPANAMMAVALRDAAPLLSTLSCASLAAEALAISAEISRALEEHAVVQHPRHGEIWAYEVDGLGGVNLMDDANIPSLISLPYLGFCAKDDPRYLRTRAFLLSSDNPQYVSGKSAAGIGGPHTGPGTIWPMALTMQALTASDDAEILQCLRYLKATHAGTGFMHESFNGDDATRFTRKWFAWANTLFGELLVTLHRQRPGLLAADLTSARHRRRLPTAGSPTLRKLLSLSMNHTLVTPSAATRTRADAFLSTPEISPLFSQWINPANGIASWILTERAASVQQSFYYTHPSFSDDGRFLWLGCGFIPDGGMHAHQVLGVVDFATDDLRVYHETQFSTSRPWIDHLTGEAYWGNNYDFWKRGPLATDKTVRVGTVPSSVVPGKLEHIATHPTFSADRSSFNVDIRSVRTDGKVASVLGEMPLDGTPFRVWQTVVGRTFNHGLFSPTDPDLQMCAQEYWIDGSRAETPFDGTTPYHRIWTIRRGEELRPFLRAPVSHSGHEWWDASGEYVWYLHYGVGVKKVSLATREETLVWPGNLSHAHASKCGRYLVADRMNSPANADCHVIFYDTVTRKSVEIVNRGPLTPESTKCIHLHPHPQFCLHDRYICYTTMVHDRVDVALTPVAELAARTS